MMTAAQRIDHLVMVLEGGNAKRFGEKAGISPQSVSSLRHGKYRIAGFAERILSAYPEVNPEWLTSGEGEPLLAEIEKGEILRKVESLEKEIRRLSELVDGLTKYQQSTNPG